MILKTHSSFPSTEFFCLKFSSLLTRLGCCCGRSCGRTCILPPERSQVPQFMAPLLVGLQRGVQRVRAMTAVISCCTCCSSCRIRTFCEVKTDVGPSCNIGDWHVRVFAFFIRFDGLIDVDDVCPDDSGQYFSQRE